MLTISRGGFRPSNLANTWLVYPSSSSTISAWSMMLKKVKLNRMTDAPGTWRSKEYAENSDEKKKIQQHHFHVNISCILSYDVHVKEWIVTQRVLYLPGWSSNRHGRVRIYLGSPVSRLQLIQLCNFHHMLQLWLKTQRSNVTCYANSKVWKMWIF